ncbi:MAG: hypothetical protein JXP34_08800 [Planctomycetes bacterium]|nr:hypothetical protein [Planctomycetota bacterium]
MRKTSWVGGKRAVELWAVAWSLLGCSGLERSTTVPGDPHENGGDGEIVASTIYKPIPLAEWKLPKRIAEGAERVRDYRAVVIVVGVSDADPAHQFGNGVILQDPDWWRRGGVPILTCAHMAYLGKNVRRRVIVGVFSHSFSARVPGIIDYQEFPASLVAADHELDLALLEAHVPARLHGLELCADDVVVDYTTAIAVAPYREAVQLGGNTLFVTAGCSGSPVLVDGDEIAGIVTSVFRVPRGAWPEVGKASIRFARQIRTFLARAGGS